MESDVAKTQRELVLKMADSISIIYGCLRDLENRISQLENEARKDLKISIKRESNE